MQHGHPLQISKKIEYGLRAMLFLASLPRSQAVPFREIAERMEVPKDFLAKILKTLARERLVLAERGAHGGYRLARAASEISFLEVIEAVEGPVHVNVCTDTHSAGCNLSATCSMFSVWRLGQEKMLEVYRNTKLDKLAMRSLRPSGSTLPVSSAG
jgi:Rrf2 family protein